MGIPTWRPPTRKFLHLSLQLSQERSSNSKSYVFWVPRFNGTKSYVTFQHRIWEIAHSSRQNRIKCSSCRPVFESGFIGKTYVFRVPELMEPDNMQQNGSGKSHMAIQIHKTQKSFPALLDLRLWEKRKGRFIFRNYFLYLEGCLDT